MTLRTHIPLEKATNTSQSAAGLCLAVALSLSACGGGNDGSPRDINRSSSEGEGWVKGEFLPADQFAHRCADPRTGSNYPDRAGSILDENNWLRSWVNDTYLWYDEVLDRDPGLYTETESYFRLLRTTERTESGRSKDDFRFTMPTHEYQAMAQSGVSVGYGIQWAIHSPTPPRDIQVVYVEPGSPADEAGVKRGQKLTAVNGLDVVHNNNTAALAIINAGLYPAQAGDNYELKFDGNLNADLTAEAITSSPVPIVKTFETESGTVGYLLFNDHTAVSEQALVDAITSLEGEVMDLILDLRYNGGGYLAIASQLSYMIADTRLTDGKVFEKLSFNDKHPDVNPVTDQPIRPMNFYSETVGLSAPAGEPLPSLQLSRVYVISGSNTCSASEAIINGLRGVDVDVILIGATTCGKPYGFYAQDNCGTTYAMTQFRGENEKGFGDYSEGFAPGSGAPGAVSLPGCSVRDDLRRQLGDPEEWRLAAALQYRESETCPTLSGGSGASMKGTVAPVEDGYIPRSPALQNRIMTGD
ncbi:S41 family peptidase [Marinimicrobium sp. ABcell2]|uniref:S41 family peptidase n=1 Tax=Marinimicrobium sp. ABcell2 TaxID=3069751 RepID=UPI0027B55326|nr:S41 family peptidase [Marinimicrobium sp. ABcell2]MDQ2076328.1 S41 family peptidase [Marinimicrobium sp. ABcell2]